ncbi:hypothetical protein H9P43_006657 [Blastocladiella emersonii ATCC 22665]|nr:hypothetical protein H9P43_006657 [Blastocladiella emersonii ATCC 22665]
MQTRSKGAAPAPSAPPPTTPKRKRTTASAVASAKPDSPRISRRRPAARVAKADPAVTRAKSPAASPRTSPTAAGKRKPKPKVAVRVPAKGKKKAAGVIIDVVPAPPEMMVVADEMAIAPAAGEISGTAMDVDEAVAVQPEPEPPSGEVAVTEPAPAPAPVVQLKSALKHPPPSSSSSTATTPSRPRKKGKLARKFVQFVPAAQLETAFEVPSKAEYNRGVTDGDWWIQFEQNKIGHAETVDVYWQLDVYKLYEMVPTMPACAQATVRFDLLKTPAQRASLLADLDYAAARALTLPQIQDRLNERLLEYDPAFRAVTPTLQAYMDALVTMVMPYEDVYNAVAGIEPAVTPTKKRGKAAPADPEPTPPAGPAFNIHRVFTLWTAVHPSLCRLASPAAVAKACEVDPGRLREIEPFVNTMHDVYFTPRGAEPDLDARRKLAMLVVMALGERPPPKVAPRAAAAAARAKAKPRAAAAGKVKAKAKPKTQGGRVAKAKAKPKPKVAVAAVKKARVVPKRKGAAT